MKNMQKNINIGRVINLDTSYANMDKRPIMNIASKSSDELINIEKFILKLLDENEEVVDPDLFNLCVNDNIHDLWYSWFTDFTLMECVKKLSQKSQIQRLNLSGQRFITDQGIIWISKYLKEFKKLTEIDLTGCSKLTNLSLSFLLNEIKEKEMELDIRFTNIQHIPLNCWPSLTTDLHNNQMSSSTNKSIPNSSCYPIIIWPSESVSKSGISIICDKKDENFSKNYLEYRRSVEIDPELPRINVMNFKLTQAPMHCFITTRVHQIIIHVTEELEEAESHLVESVAYFLSKEQVIRQYPFYPTEKSKSISKSELNIIDDRPVPVPVQVASKKPLPTTKSKKAPQKMKKMKSMQQKVAFPLSDDEPEEAEVIVIPYNPQQTNGFIYQGIQIQNNIITRLESQTGYFISKLPFDNKRTIFSISNSRFKIYEYNDLIFGVSEYYDQKLLMTPPDQIEPLVLINFKHQSDIIVQLRTPEFNEHKIAFSGKIMNFSLTFGDNLLNSSQNKRIVKLQINDQDIWSKVITIDTAKKYVPYLVMPKEFRSTNLLQIDDYWIVEETFEPVKPECFPDLLHLNFVVLCSGTGSTGICKTLSELKWIEKLKENVKKLEDTKNDIKKKSISTIDFKEQHRLSEIVKQMDNLNEFISKVNERIKFFGIESIQENSVKSIMDVLKEGVRAAFNMEKYRFSENVVNKCIDSIVNLKQKYLTVNQIRNILAQQCYSNLDQVLQKMTEDINGIYLQNTGMFILDIEWFDDLLASIVKDIPQEANHRSVGIHPSAKVWNKSGLQNLLKSKDIKLEDIPKWLETFCDLGIFTRVPCLRYGMQDEPCLFVCPMLMTGAKEPHLQLIKENYTDKKILKASISYKKLNQDIYSLYPCLISRIIDLGTLQLLSPKATVLHISGGIELIVEPNMDSLDIDASFLLPPDNKMVYCTNVLHFLWNVMHLCSDAFEALLMEQNILVNKVTSSELIPANYSLGYCHEWDIYNVENTNVSNVCALCNNCSSSKSSNCPFNRLASRRRGYCLCASSQNMVCSECGICFECFNKYWQYHTTADPCRLMFCDNNILQPVPWFSGQSPIITVQLLKPFDKNPVKIITQKENVKKTVEISKLTAKLYKFQFWITSITNYNFDKSKKGLAYLVSSEVYMIHEHQLIIFNPIDTTNIPVGICISKLPFTRERRKFSIEIINVGRRGRITVGVVPKDYAIHKQPGWNSNSVGFHGDDGGLYEGSGEFKKSLKSYSVKGTKVYVEMSYNDDDKVTVTFSTSIYSETLSATLKNNVDYYGAIGLHSEDEQVRLLDPTLWSLEDKVLDDNDIYDDFMISKEEEMEKSMEIYPSNIVEIQNNQCFVCVKSKNPIKSIAFDVTNLTGSVENIIKFSLKTLGIDKTSNNSNTVTINNPDSTKNEYITTHIHFKTDYSEYLESYKLKVTLNYDKGQVFSKLLDMKIKNLVNYSILDNRDDPLEISDETLLPCRKGYLLHVLNYFENNSKEVVHHNKFILPLSELLVQIKGNSTDCLVYSDRFVKSNFTRDFQIGNMVMNSNKPQIIISKDGETLKLQDQTEIKADSSNLQPVYGTGAKVMTHKFLDSDKNRSFSITDYKSFKLPPLSKPWLMLFNSVKIDMAKYYCYYRCREYRGVTMCMINNLSRSIFPCLNSTTVTQTSLIALPFNPTTVKDAALLLWEHSLLDILDPHNYAYYFICNGDANLMRRGQPHLLDTRGVPTDASFWSLFANPNYVETLKKLMNHKLIIAKNDLFLPDIKLEYSNRESEELLSIIMDKILGYMIFNCLLIDEKDLCKVLPQLDLKSVVEESNNALTVNQETLSCLLHNQELRSEVSLQKIIEDPNNLDSLLTSKWIQYSKCAVSLVLEGTGINKLPKEFFEYFENLKFLELRNFRKLENIPESIYEIHGLEQFDLTDVFLTELPNISKFQMLKSFNCTRSTATKIATSKKMPDFNRLTSMKLLNVPLDNFPVELCQFSHLRTLEIKLIGLKMIPDEFANLINLEHLEITGSSIYYELLSNKMTSTIKLDDNDSHYPEIDLYKVGSKDSKKNMFMLESSLNCFLSVPRLGNSNSSQLDRFPASILELINLKSLKIHHTALFDIPNRIDQLVKLESIDLSYNLILTNISSNISHLTSLNKITLLHCPALVAPPREIIERGTTAIKSYFKYLSTEKVRCNRTKLMVVGLGEAGKTSLIRALKSSDNTSISSGDTTVTDGIDIAELKLKRSNGEEIKFSTWDFAGQDVYYNTHQFFLSSNSMYIVVFSVRLGIEHGDLDFWLSSIACHAKNAPVIVVGTRCAEVSLDESSFNRLKERYEQIRSFILVDSVKGTNIKNLRNILVEEASKLPFLTQDIPTSILELEQQIITNRSKQKYMAYKDFEKFAEETGVMKKDLEQVIQILHDFGSIQYFNTELLKNQVVIDPQWIVDVMANVVSVVDQHIKNGIFYHEKRKNVWSNYDESMYDWMLSLTEQFDLTFAHPTEPGANIVPCLLSEEQPEIKWPLMSEDLKWKYSEIHYIFDFLPAGLFNRIQVRLFDFTESKDVWKYGTYFRKNDHQVLLLRKSKSNLTIQAIGVNPVNVLAMVDEVIVSLIRNFFPGVKYQLKIPCPDCINEGRNESEDAVKYWSSFSLIPTSIIRKAMEKKADFIQCEELHLNTIKSLKDNSPETSPPDQFLIDLQSNLQKVSTLAMNSKSTLTLLYSTKDTENNNFISLSDLENVFSKFNFQYTKVNEIIPDNWKKMISNSKLCITILSENFLAIPNTSEIYAYIKLHKKKHILIITGKDGNAKANWDVGIDFINVYVKLNVRAKNYENNLEELQKSMKNCLKEEVNQDIYDCFISYAWANSQDAVNNGTKVVEGAISCSEADPRKIAEFLEKEGIKCWIDKSMINKYEFLTVQLSKAIQKSKIMIAFVSKEYGESDNCRMEYLYMAETIQRPIIPILVGTGSSINLHSAIIMQIKKSSKILEFNSHDEKHIKSLIEGVLLKTVKETVAGVDIESLKTNEIKNDLQQLSTALDEQVELVFRQFLNHMIETFGNGLPHLIVLDEIDDSKQPPNKQIESSEEGQLAEKENCVEELSDTYCIRIICESEDGWHISDMIRIPVSEVEGIIDKSAKFLAILYEVLKFKNPGLNCLQPDVIKDSKLLNRVNQIFQASETPLKDSIKSYDVLRNFFEKKYNENQSLDLNRYRLPSGRILWLCDKDANGQRRLKKLEKDEVSSDSVTKAVEDYDSEFMTSLLDKLKELGQKFEEVTDDGVKMEKSKVTHAPPPLLRQDTNILIEKVKVRSKQNESSKSKLKPISENGSKNKSDGELLSKRRGSKLNRTEIQGSRICLLQ